MSEERHIVCVKKEDLNFTEFYNEYLNKNNEFELSYCTTDGGKSVNVDLLKEIRDDIKFRYDEAIKDNFATSNSFFHVRKFVWALIDYVESKGKLTNVRYIEGWEPQLVIVEQEEKIKKVTIPKKEDTRYPYTYACDFLRICIPYGENGCKISRCDASIIIQEISKVLSIDNRELACKISDYSLKNKEEIDKVREKRANEMIEILKKKD